ncbi:MAG: AMP-binding protein, partial [Acidimicrobiia bacterium]
MSEPVTIADLFRSHIGNTRPAVQFGSDTWTYEQVLTEVAQRAAFLLDHKPASAPFHVGVLFDNTPEMWFALGACAVSGATLVGINPTRRGAELARDIEHTDCAV